MKVKTKVGVIDAVPPGMVGPRVKFWAEAMSELARLEEIYGVLGAALDEAYRAGQASALQTFVNGWATKLNGPVVDVEFKVVKDEKELSSVDGSSEELLNERKLAEAARLGQELSESASQSSGPVSQVDGSAGTEA
jgi:hypothetical protein